MIKKILSFSHLSTILKILLTIIILWAIFSRLRIRDLASSFRTMDLAPFILALCFVIFNVLFQVVKWHLLLRTHDSTITLKEATFSLLGGITLSIATPGRIGDALRIFFVSSPDKLELSALYVLDKGSNSTMILASGLLGIAMVFPFTVVAIYTLVFLLILGFWITPRSYTFLLRRRRNANGAAVSKWQRFRSALSQHSLSVRLLCLFWAFAFYAFGIFQYYLILHAFGEPKFAGIAVSYPVMSLAGTLPTIGGLGPRELICQKFLPYYGGISESGAVNAAFLLYVINVAMPGLIGLVVIRKLNMNVTSLMKRFKKNPETK
jgi:hypothetical protein